MEAFPHEALNLVCAFVGEPDTDPKAPPIGSIFVQLFSIANASRALLAWYKHWYDWEMDILFHH